MNIRRLEVSRMSQKMVYLSLGSNIGDRLGYLSQATRLLNEYIGISITKISSVYETAAWGLEAQADFYNIAVEIATSLLPRELLEVCQEIENRLERTREIQWGPRTVDIDILLYEDIEIDEESLIIPHKYLLQRPFVTIPLAEIAPDKRVKGVRIAAAAKGHSELKSKCLRTSYTVDEL